MLFIQIFLFFVGIAAVLVAVTDIVDSIKKGEL